jgi:hypothetical protein
VNSPFIRPARRPRTRRRWRRALIIIGGLGLLASAPVLARAQGAGQDSVRLAWTAPGDDGSIGTATGYEMRLSTSPITAGNWGSAAVVSGGPSPAVSGTHQTWTVRGLDRANSYYFAIKAVDDAGNWSGISNVLRWDWVVDTAPPSAPGGVSAAKQGSSVHVHWSANSESDLQGYSIFRATSASGPFSQLNGSLMSSVDYVDSAIPGGASAVWYQISATDETGNQSARSAAATVSLASTGGAGGDWAMEPGYPNPSAGSAPVNIAVVIPEAGAAGAVVDITDDAGRRVRRIDLGGLLPGRRLVVWDGKNDAGRIVAPGVYSAWVLAGNTRNSVRLVRVP